MLPRPITSDLAPPDPLQDVAEALMEQLEDVIVHLGQIARSDVGDGLERLIDIAHHLYPREMANEIPRPYGPRRPSLATPWVFESGVIPPD